MRHDDERVPHGAVRDGLPADDRAQDLLAGLMQGADPGVIVPAALVLVERDPLASGGAFRGDLVRGLMEVPGAYWGRRPRLYQRYVRALRACAAARRSLPTAERMEFWCAFEVPPAPSGAVLIPSPDEETHHGDHGAS